MAPAPLGGVSTTNGYDPFLRRKHLVLLTNGVTVFTNQYGYNSLQPIAGFWPTLRLAVAEQQLLGVQGLATKAGASSRLFIRTRQHTGHPHPVFVLVNLGKFR